MIKKLGILAGFCLLLAFTGMSCAGKKQEAKDGKNEQASEKQLVGNARDDHGCLTSAGYQWSEAKRDCIRVWEEGTKLAHGDQHLFAVFSPDSSQVEIFMSSKDPFMLQKQEEAACWVQAEGTNELRLEQTVLKAHIDGVDYR